MAQSTFKNSLKYVLVYEGGKVDDPRDPGGRTNQGVTQRVYSAYRSRQGQAPRDVHLMTAVERDMIYRRQYWDAIEGDKLPAGVDLVIFDAAVNSGPKQAAKWLQRALRVEADGHIGFGTLSAAANHPNHDGLVQLIADQRMSFLQRLRHWRHYKNGWSNRVKHVTAAGMIFASGPNAGPAPAPQFFFDGNHKAPIDDAEAFDQTAAADMTTGAGTTTAVLSQAAYTLSPFTDNPNIQYIVLALTLAGVALAVGGGIWSFVARLRNQDRAAALGSEF